MSVQTIISQIEPRLGEVFGIQFWFYGATYAIGILGIFIWMYLRQRRVNISVEQVYELALYVGIGLLLGGRAFDIIVYERAWYLANPAQILCFWKGGMASHGVLLGATLGIWLFCRRHAKSFLSIIEELLLPAALFLALGRLGNFVNGYISGSGSAGFEHPVTLYESAKNVVVFVILVFVYRKAAPGRGLLLAHFIFWYGFLRFFTDLFRRYETTLWGVGMGQYFNLLMAVIGLALILWFQWHGELMDRAVRLSQNAQNQSMDSPIAMRLRRVGLVLILFLSLTIPSSWTQEVLRQMEIEKNTASAEIEAAGDNNERAAAVTFFADSNERGRVR